MEVTAVLATAVGADSVDSGAFGRDERACACVDVAVPVPALALLAGDPLAAGSETAEVIDAAAVVDKGTAELTDGVVRSLDVQAVSIAATMATPTAILRTSPTVQHHRAVVNGAASIGCRTVRTRP